MKTLGRAAALVAAAPGRQHAVGLRAGRVFPGTLDCGRGGPSDKAPDVWYTWGDGPRAVVLAPIDDGIAAKFWGSWNVVLAGLDLTCDRAPDRRGDPKRPNIGLRGWNAGNILVEDCIVDQFARNAVFEVQEGKVSKNIVIRRSTLADSWAPDQSTHSQGIYCHGVDGLALEDVALVGNGRLLGVAPGTQFNHNAYIDGTNKDVSIRGLVSLDAASHGLQLRCGGEAEDLFLAGNPCQVQFGLVRGAGPRTKGGATGNLRRLVVFGNAPIDADGPRSLGVEIGNLRDSFVTDLLFVDDACDMIYNGAVHFAYDNKAATKDDDVGVSRVTVRNVGLVRWRRRVVVEPTVRAGTGPGTIEVSEVTLEGFSPGQDQIRISGLEVQELGSGDPVKADPKVVTLREVLLTVGLTPETFRHYWRTRARGKWDPKMSAASLVATSFRIARMAVEGVDPGVPVPLPNPTPTPPGPGEPSKPTVLTLTARDPADNSLVDVSALLRLPRPLGFLAEVTPLPDRVDFLLDGVVFKTERTAPYSMAGDQGGKPLPVPLGSGVHKIRAVAVARDGSPLSSQELTITLLPAYDPAPVDKIGGEISAAGADAEAAVSKLQAELRRQGVGAGSAAELLEIAAQTFVAARSHVADALSSLSK